MKKTKILLLSATIVLEMAGIIFIVKSISSETSPVFGIVFLVIGLAFFIIGISKKGSEDKNNSI